MHVVYNGWFWDQPNTGSGQYLRHLLRALSRAAPDLQMTLVLPPGLTSADGLPDTINVVPTSGSRSNLGKVWFEQRTFPQIAGGVGADIAHVPYWGAPLASPIPLVTSVLDVIPLALPEYSAGARGRLYTALVSASARGSTQVITISDAAKADIVRYLGIPEAAITTTHLAADEVYHPRMGSERDAAVREKYHLPDNFVLYMGGFDVRKQVNDALLAYTYCGPAHGEEYPLVIAGREPAWGTPMFPDLRAYAEQLQVTDYVRWIGYVDEADKPSLYRLADVFVYPSVYEGFGLPVLEAMASGTPVVAREIPVIEEITGDAAYLVQDARTMAGAIIALILQEPLRQSQVSRGLAWATQFSWRKAARETVGVYERVLSQEQD
ncbi:MAG: glycosyltransferase family 4 protein [Anaerolineae bacterium]|nr:glycosyltransferase family 4 protein [Anaerolineae bacterium]